MSNINDKATVELFVNGEQAEAAMDRLRKKASDLDNELRAAMDAGDEKQAAKLQRELDKVNRYLGRIESSAKGTGVVLNDLSNSSIHGLRNALKYLQKQLSVTRPDTETWHRYAASIEQVKGRIAELNGELEGSQSLWGKFKDWAQGTWPALDLMRQWDGSITNVVRECVDAYASMDQEMANVRKFTGMTAGQVGDLNEEFKKMDTRTSREDLNKLAQEAGRLGKTSKEDVLGFVRAADQINVALDELGDGATLTLSKLTGIFGDEARYGTEQSLLKVGSVVNDLSQNCRASAPYLVEFAARMGGVGAQAKMTIPQIMAFGAVLDSYDQKVEASSTALSQVIVRLYQDPQKYAKVAGIDVEKFSKLMREDANAAVILFLETLQKAGGMDVLSPMFKDMGENGSRAITALSTLATHIDEVKNQQKAANKAFEDGTSVGKEYTIQNETVQAALDKCKNDAHELKTELGERLYPLMGHLYTATSALIKATLTIIKFVAEHKAAIVALAAALSAYLLVVKSELVLKKLRNAIDTAYYALLVIQEKITRRVAVVTEGLRMVYFKLRGQISQAMVAQQAFNKAMSSTPWGAILTAITAAIAAFKMFDDQVENATEKYEVLDKAKEDAAVKYNEEKYLLDQNIKKVKEFSGTKEQEQALISQLNDKYGPILDTYSSLSDWLKTLTTRGNDYCLSLQQQIVMEAKLEQARQLVAKAAKLRNEGDGEEYTYGSSLWNWITTNLEEIKFIPNGSATYHSMDELDQKHWDEYWARAELKAQQAEAQAAALRAEAEAEAEAAKASFPTVEVSDEIHTPYVSSVMTGKREREIAKTARAQALAERRALAMAKKEFQAEMEEAKGDYEFDTAQNIMAYGSGLKTYEEYLAEKERLDLDYVDRRMEIYNNLYAGESETDKKLLLMYDEDYQSFLLKKAELTNKFASERAKRSIADLKREYGMENANLEFEFNSPSSKYYGDTRAQQERLHELKIEYLLKYRDTYKKNSKEWLEYEAQIDAAEQAHILQQRKDLMASYETWVSQYSNISAQRRYNIEVGIVEKLYEQKKISEEQYQLWLAQLREKYNSESTETTTAATNAKYTVAGPGGDIDIRSDKDQIQARVVALKNQRTSAINELDERLAGGLITQSEYDEGVKKIEKAYQKNLFAPVRDGLDEQTRMLFDLGVAWADFFKSISENGELSFENIKDVAVASVATICAALQTYSQFMEAEKRIELAAVEKRYDREIELAQGNSYKVAKLEKKKEDKIAEVKAEYARKEFAVKVIMAVAQTAQNALLGYAAGLQAGFPMATWLAPLLAGMAVAQGAIQVALLKKQQQAAAAQGYSQGGFTKPGPVDEPAGIVHAGEWVASQKLLANPVARPMIEALDLAQRTNTIGSLKAEDVSRSIRANDSLARIAEGDGSAALMVAAVAQNSQVIGSLVSRLNEPFVTVNTVTGDHGIKQAQDEYTRLMNNITPKSKRK